ncbi:hypothetical protein SE91_25880 [Bradyrhizobium sp. DOA1]|nr:hypothetical protein SE91_25880 [Bradyrhizobium sp. DOA1]
MRLRPDAFQFALSLTPNRALDCQEAVAIENDSLRVSVQIGFKRVNCLGVLQQDQESDVAA